MKLISTLNSYFLSEDEQEIQKSDCILFYGFYGFIILLPVILWLYIIS